MRFHGFLSTPGNALRFGFACAATTLLAFAASGCGAPVDEPTASATDQPALSATGVTLVHDIPSDHPRIPYFATFSDNVLASTDGQLAVEINPNGEVLAGRASLDAVRSGAADLALVNMSHIEAMEPAAGFMNLPFAFNDALMADEKNRTAVFDTEAELIRPHGLELLGYMRGADQLLAFPNDDVNTVEDLADRRIRVAGGGIYEQLMTRLGAEPVAVPIPQIKELMANGGMDGVFTSPGGWTTQVLESAPHAVQVPGLMYISYALVANRDRFDALPRDQREALATAGADLTGQWVQMAQDDQAAVNQAVSGGATYRILPDEEVARWRERVIGISDSFYREHTALADDLRQRGLIDGQ